MNFGNANLGDQRRTKRLVRVADAIVRHPGLINQILHRRPHVRKNESAVKKRARVDRESRLWLEGTQTLPAEYGEHGNQPLLLWIVRVWEPNPPEGVEPLEWFLLTNHPVCVFADAWDVVSWYGMPLDH